MAQPITWQCIRCQLRYTANGSKVCTPCLKNPKILTPRGVGVVYQQPRNYTWKDNDLDEDQQIRKRLAERKEKREEKKGTVKIPTTATVRFGKPYKGRIIKKAVRSYD